MPKSESTRIGDTFVAQPVTAALDVSYALVAGRVSLNVSLTPELADYVREQMRGGRYGSVSEVIRAALRHFASIEPAATATKPDDKDR